MSIASAIQNAQAKVAAAYTAISNKGGTLPATQDLSNMPTAIASIPSGGSSEKFGANINTFLGDIDANGILQIPTAQSDLVFTGVEDVVANVLHYKFAYTNVKSVSFPALTIVSREHGLASVFIVCTSLTSVDLSSLITISGRQGLYSAFGSCTSLTSVDLSSLTTVSGSQGLSYTFRDCTSLTSVDLSSLTTVSGSQGLSYAFYGCTGLKDVYFRALTTLSFGSSTNQFTGLIGNTGTTTTHTLHFPSNLESTISGLSGYPNFGGASKYVALAFDLPATS